MTNFLSQEAAYWQRIQEYSDSDGLQNIWTSHLQSYKSSKLQPLEAIEKMGSLEATKASKGEALVARALCTLFVSQPFFKPL